MGVILFCYRLLAVCLGTVSLLLLVRLLGGCQSNHSVSTLSYRVEPGLSKHDLARQLAAAEQDTRIIVPDVQNHTADVLPEVAKAVMQLEKQGQGKKVIAMSLYGSDTRYTQGAVENAMLAKRDWPGWTYRVYYGAGVPADVLQAIQVCCHRERATRRLTSIILCCGCYGCGGPS
jgi:hypothetical protein